jgi:subtilase family serine protease
MRGQIFLRAFDGWREVCENEGVNQNSGFQSRRLFFAIGMALFFSFALSAQTVGKQMLRGHVPPAVARFHLQPVDRVPATNRLNLAIGLPLRNQDALNELLREIYDPGSTNYHRYLTPEEFTEQFGPTEQDYAAVVNFAKTNGLTVTATYPNRTLVDVSANAATVEKVFHVALRVYRHPVENRNFFAPDGEPSIDLDIPISHVSGLDNFTIPRPAILKKNLLKSNSSGVTSASGSGPGGLYIGNDFRAAYAPGVTLNGTGQSVALLELDGYFTNDIALYESQAGLSNAVVLTNVLIDSFSGAAGSDNVEVALDIEMAVAMAPALSKVIVYEESNGGNIADLLNRMVSDNAAKQISSSWLIGDDPSFDIAYKQMAAQGQSFFQASGDDGAFYTANENVEQNTDDTNVTLVGGTTLSTTTAGGAWSSETVWNWYITDPANAPGGSGGGTNFNGIAIPSWQTGINMTTNQGSTTLRNIPDVALTADNIFIVADNGQQESVGGTSAAAPLWAGYAALMNQQAVAAGRTAVGFVNPAVYAIGASAGYATNFHDITTGNNTNTTVVNKYFAVPGYDLCTGWGTPAGQNLITSLAGQPDAFGITPAVGFNAVGFISGPFAPNSQNILLTNSGATSLNWVASNSASWLTISSTNGTLAAAGQTTLTVSLNSAANNLAIGFYIADILFTNRNDGGWQSRRYTLQVFDSLGIKPATGFTAAGVAGGPFNVTAQNFTLSNMVAASLNWRVANTSAWLNVSPVSGTLAGGGQTNVSASLNSVASNLVSGIYNSTVFFTNQTSGTVQNRQFTLFVGQPLIQNGGFETGDFTGWTLNGDGSPDNYVDNGSTVPAIAPHSGTYFAALGESGLLAFLSQNVPTFAGQSYLLSLWLNSPNVNPHTPNEFSVAWNGGTLFDKVNIGKIGWTNLQFIVTAASSSTVLQFGARDDNYYLGLDDVSLVPIPTAAFQTTSLTATNNNLKFVWNSLTGLVYQVQFKTNLLQTNWLVLKSITATNTVTTFADTNPITAMPQKFYRLQLLP